MQRDEIRSYRDLKVWQDAMDLAARCYVVTRSFPRSETYGMTSQIRRAAASVPANIAEGYGRDSAGNYVQFLRHAQGSLKELETHLLLSARVALVPAAEVDPLLDSADSLGRMLRSLIRSIESQSPGPARR
ncbi:four helix bundle protein [uncultured Alsobacter sp.]|uniref:four helix bundle protein n=1 Tax=uncultured Alsobacter sp. TaxID=1748258 RepID=UPI0025D11311|nr:four helix bundle protein [uncultured Alsobacter sp.]